MISLEKSTHNAETRRTGAYDKALGFPSHHLVSVKRGRMPMAKTVIAMESYYTLYSITVLSRTTGYLRYLAQNNFKFGKGGR